MRIWPSSRRNSMRTRLPGSWWEFTTSISRTMRSEGYWSFTAPRLGRKSPPKCRRSAAKHNSPRARRAIRQHALLGRICERNIPTPEKTFAETVHAVTLSWQVRNRSPWKRSKCSPTLSNLKPLRMQRRQEVCGTPADLLETFLDFHVDAERAVLIAQRDHGNVAIHVVFHLNDLLLR